MGEGFIAMEAEDSTEAKNIGNRVLALARGLGVEKRALRRSRSIMELADRNFPLRLMTCSALWAPLRKAESDARGIAQTE